MINLISVETERLRLRPMKAEDAEQVFILRSDETINKYVNRPRATSIDDARSFIDKIAQLSESNETFYRAITLKEDDQLIGTITLWNFNADAKKAEIGYELLPQYHGKGYMLEAVKKVIDLAFTQFDLLCVEGWTHPGNNNSNRLLEKLGFKRDHKAEQTKPADAKEIIYSLKAGDHS